MFDPDKFTDGRIIAAKFLGLIELAKLNDPEEFLLLLIKEMKKFFECHSPAKTAKSGKIDIECKHREKVVYALNATKRFLKGYGYDVAITWREDCGYQWRAKKDGKTYRSRYDYVSKKEDMSY